MHKIVTYISVARNNLSGLSVTYKSLLCQGQTDFQWLVIDGASDDGTIEFLSSLKPPFAFDFISESDSGIFDAMNKGIALAAGQYVNFLNAGDQLCAPDTFTTVHSEIARGVSDLIYGDSYQKSGTARSPIKRARSAADISFGMFACHQSIYYRRELIGALRYRESLRCAGDYAFTAEFLSNNQTAKYLPQPLCVFDTSGISSQNEALGRRENWIIQRDILYINLATRAWNQCRYVAAAALRKYLAGVYRSLRFQRK